ncbi:hypothetical protein RND81_03G154300 [Saponaria officinalis]|uniref:Uncharacterized protein n=1 Tax=Saponaria officinalis TaxID=3572 RepID=A0AAW1M984_SAPOF
MSNGFYLALTAEKIRPFTNPMKLSPLRILPSKTIHQARRYMYRKITTMSLENRLTKANSTPTTVLYKSQINSTQPKPGQNLAKPKINLTPKRSNLKINPP